MHDSGEDNMEGAIVFKLTMLAPEQMGINWSQVGPG